MSSRRDFEVSSFDALAIPKLKLKIEKLEIERKEIKSFNELARKENKKTYPPKILDNLRNRIKYYNKRIDKLKEFQTGENKIYIVNDVKVIENFNEHCLEFHFKKAPYFKTISKLRKNGFIWEENKKCWYRVLEKNNSKLLKIIK